MLKFFQQRQNRNNFFGSEKRILNDSYDGKNPGKDWNSSSAPLGGTNK